MSQIKIPYNTGDLDINIISVNSRCADISVNDDLTIDMRVPVGMQADMIESFVRMNEKIILQEYEQKKMRNHQTLPVMLELENGKIQYRSGQLLPIFGEMSLCLRVKYNSELEEIKIYDQKRADGKRELTIQTDNETQSFLRYCVMKYYKKCAADIVKEKIFDFGKQMNLQFQHVQISGQVRSAGFRMPGLTYKNIEIKNQKTLWGSCNRKKNLKFDWKLAMLPIEVIEYIIVHELAHLKKMNHSESFWREIENVMPEYRECRSWLNKHGKEYEIF